MKIVILTTETLHHTYFVREICKIHSIDCVFIEEATSIAPFDVGHPYENAREQFEQSSLFQNQESRISAFAETININSINDDIVIKSLRRIRPDLTVVFGTGKLGKTILTESPGIILNLHGGDPERYRGLDSHLWAIYHNDYEGLQTTLHYVNQELDDGHIVLQTQIDIKKGMKLFELRTANVKACIDLVTIAITNLENGLKLPEKVQRRKGRYYSFMPSCLKEICLNRFENHTKKLL